MSDLFRKFNFNGKAIVLQAPEDQLHWIMANGCSVKLPTTGTAGNILVFITGRNSAIQFLERHLSAFETDAVCWIAFAKATSTIASDLNRDSLNELVKSYGLRAVTAISIDNNWSALRFRPISHVISRK